MSHTAQIDYEQYAVRCQSVCEAAESELARTEEALKEMDRDSSAILGERSDEFRKAVSEERESLLAEIKALREEAEKEGKRGVVRAARAEVPGFMRRAEELSRRVDAFAVERPAQYGALLTELLGESLREGRRKAEERRSGAVTVDAATQRTLDSIRDPALRQFTLIAYVEDNALAGEDLRRAGERFMDDALNKTYEQRLEEERERMRAEMKAAKVDPAAADRALEAGGASARERLENARAAATEEIVGEKVRQKSIKIIREAIEARGFIVDAKNIKIKRDTDEVVMVGLKASGEKAEFRVFLDGRFIYDFRGYEGQACQKDIEPFMKDLEEVYGFHVTDRKEIWSNPDKISTMKYQTYDTNKNKG